MTIRVIPKATHSLEVSRDRENHGFYARCSCGWDSRRFTTQQRAWNAAHKHEDEQ